MSILSRLLIVPLVVLLALPARALTEAECRQDAENLLAEISRNRRNSVESYRLALAAAGGETERERLKEQMEQVWHEEELQLGLADQILRDCLRYLQSLQRQSID